MLLGHQNRQERRRATMISAKRLAQMAKKWQRIAALGRKRITWTTPKATDECCSSVAVKGHCIMYTADGRRFEVPLAFLATTIFAELLRMSQEEFGFTTDGGITLPCDAEVMEYVLCLLRRNASEEVVRAFLSTIVKSCHYGNGFTQSLGLHTITFHQLIHKAKHCITPHSTSHQLKTQDQEPAMISARRVAQLAKKWQRMAALGRKRLTVRAKQDQECCSSMAGKGHCAMYTADGSRFEVPLVYLGTAVFSELLRMSQEEFGFSIDGRIMLPCDAAVMEYAMCLLRRNASVEVEKALLSSMVASCHYTGSMVPIYGINQQISCL
uniref:Auxin induced protein n=1 Tax=Oryza rufipogon TaxID=4529 RepID=A0A0E0QUL6_ORYRU